MRVVLMGLLCLSTVVSLAPAQSANAKRQYEAGKKLYDDNKCDQAIAPLEDAVKQDRDYADALYYLGECYELQDRHDDAIATYTRLEQVNPNAWAYYYYMWGQAYLAKADWEAAKHAYRQFLAKYDTSATRTFFHHRAMYRLRYAEESPALRARPAAMGAPVNLGEGVNSRWAEFMPNSDPTGRIMYFSSQRKGGFDARNGNDAKGWGDDIWRVERTADGWSTPTVLPEPINTYNNDGAASFSGDGQTMVYAACGLAGGVGNCDIYIATLEGTTWTKPKNLGNVVNSDAWDSQPSISADGTTIIFVSERKGSYGATDLYLTRRNRFGEWGVPVNLGEVVNTPLNEYSPSQSPDGKTLYFSSYGHPGYGEADLFVTVFENGRWTEPVNLGAPINSPGDDRYFTVGGSGEVAYFASDRAGTVGDMDLYQVDLPEEMRPKPTVVVAGTVTNEKTQSPIGAWVLVEDIASGELIATHKSNSSSGRYLVVLPVGRDYSVSATSDGFFFYSQRFAVPADARYQEITRDIPLSPIEKGSRVVLNNVFFETGQATLSPESRVELRKVVDLMTTNRTVVIEVGGHTDNVGSADANMRLSHQRALAVREFIVNAGVPGERVQAKGYGQTNPVASNDTPEGRQANRRTEIIIVEG